MKYLLIIAGLTVGMNCWSQSPVAAVELTQQKVLYRGYTNKVVPAVTNKAGQKVKLVGTNAKAETVDGEDYFIVKLKGREKTETLHTVVYDGVKVDTIESVVYKVANLPAPSIYWGDWKSGGIGNITSKNLSIGYPEGIPLKNEFDILSWEISANNEVAKGVGNDVSSAESFLKKIPNGTVVLFFMKVRSGDGIIRAVSAQWEVKSWAEEVKMNPLGFDRE